MRQISSDTSKVAANPEPAIESTSVDAASLKLT
jgi:hypothetical protein